MMNRRTFAGAFAYFVAQGPRVLHGQGKEQTISIDLRSGSKGRTLPTTFTGLSYELSQLTEPSFFSADNTALVALFRALSPSGILRIGGNTSEFCWFRATPGTAPPKLRMPTGDVSRNWMPHRLFEITPAAIDNLRGFLDATGWIAIYGLNFGNSTPARTTEEAEYVSRVLGTRLAFFQIGNEPDFYRDANNGTRPAGWGFADYVREWLEYANAIVTRVPSARFGGPDTGASSDWVTRFGQEVAPKLNGSLVALTGHYYAEGPPNDPKVTTERLLAANPAVIKSTTDIVRVADELRLTYHMSEGNSCYRGGKPGMSDAFAASLWAADYLLTLAQLGCGGVNLHGGSSRFLSAGLGDHNPGLEVPGVKKAASNGFYTPIATEPGSRTEARPVFYGMLFAQQFAGSTMLNLASDQNELIRVFAARQKGRTIVAVINKGTDDVTVSVNGMGTVRRGGLLRLTAPSLDSTSGVRFGGVAVNDGGWKPRRQELVGHGGRVSFSVAGYSAAIVNLS